MNEKCNVKIYFDLCSSGRPKSFYSKGCKRNFNWDTAAKYTPRAAFRLGGKGRMPFVGWVCVCVCVFAIAFLPRVLQSPGCACRAARTDSDDREARPPQVPRTFLFHLPYISQTFIPILTACSRTSLQNMRGVRWSRSWDGFRVHPLSPGASTEQT